MADFSTISLTQQKRLAFIDFCLEFFGQVARADLVGHFQTGIASATRDLTLYKSLAPDNLVLKHQTKLYYRTAEFSPLFPHHAEEVLFRLANKDADKFKLPQRPSDVCVEAVRLIHASSSTIAPLLRAIMHKKAIHCRYVSLSSGITERELVPHSLINNGYRWHVRCYDRSNQAFRDFVSNRFLDINLLDGQPLNTESVLSDTAWNNVIPLDLIPHPGVKHKQAIELDYNMTNGSLTVQTREALLGYLTQAWRVDCSANYRLDPMQFPLALANKEVLKNMDVSPLLPGVTQ